MVEASLRRLRNNQYTVGWVCALPIELAAAQQLLDERHDAGFRNVEDSNIYTLGRLGEHNVVIACLPYSQMGTNSAATVAAQMRSAFPTIDFVLMVGIGGGIPQTDCDVRLGDVVVSRPNGFHGGVVQYDFGKVTKDGFQRTRFLNNPPTLLLNAITNLEAKHARGQMSFMDSISQLNKLDKFDRKTAGPDLLFRANYDHIGGLTCLNCDPGNLVQRMPRGKEVMIHYGTVASGNQVIKNALERDKLSSELGGILCFEMEAAGLMNDFPCLVVRGICDYADSHKNKGWQGYAAGTAAAYAKELLTMISPHEAQQRQISGATMLETNEILRRLPYALDAPFNSYKRRNDPICLANTRIEILDEIDKWVHAQDQRYLFWLNGLAGTGKSTIARTIARQSFDTGYLGASFFFSRGGGDTGIAEKFVTTIARQLASQSPALGERICETIQQHGDICNRSLIDQWRYLILKPLSITDNPLLPPFFVIVIDALDECGNEDDIMTILRLLGETQHTKVQLRFFLTSRPEVPVRQVFYKIRGDGRRNLVLHEIIPETIRDLNLFFTAKLAETAETHDLGVDWPGNRIKQQLVDHAGGLFIWAATACRFIDDGKQFASDRLSTILQHEKHGKQGQGDEPQKHLDDIYNIVFIHSMSRKHSERERGIAYALLRYVLGTIVVIFSQLSTKSVANLLGIANADIQSTLRSLHAILVVPENVNSTLRLHHPSLRDFLLDHQRCTNPDLYVNEKDAHRKTLVSCIRLMSGALKKDICGLGSPGTLLVDVERRRVEEHVSPELQYACLYWVQHLVKSNTPLHDNDFIHCFLETHLLQWLEVTSLIEKVSEVIHNINSLLSHISNTDCPELLGFVQDAKRFLQYNQHCLQQAPLQVYFGALVFAPVRSVVREKFKEQSLQWIKVLPEIRADWGACLQTLEGHSQRVSCVAFRADGKMLASASDDCTIRIWDPTTGQCLQTLEGCGSRVYSVAFQADGNILASATGAHTVYLWNSTNGECLQILEGHCEPVTSVVYQVDGSRLLASTSFDRTIRLWDPATGQCLQILEGHTDWVRSVAFQRNSKMLASAGDDTSIRLWDRTTGQCLQILKGHSTWINSVAFKPDDGDILASASYDSTLRLWDANTGQCVQILHGHSSSVESIVFRADGKILASASGDNTILLWNPKTGQCLQELQGHGGCVNSVVFQADGNILASASNDNTIHLWDPTNGQDLQALKGHTEGHSDRITCLTFRSDSTMLASASKDKTIRLWDPTTGQCLQTLKGHRDQVNAALFRADGRMLASTSKDDCIRLWDTDTGQCLHTLKGHNTWIKPIALQADGKMLASTSSDNHIRLWDTSTGNCLHTLKGHTDHINCVVFRADGTMLASASYEQSIRLWDPNTGQCLRTLEGHSSPSDQAWSVVFQADGKTLVSALGDESVKLGGHSDCVLSVAFRPDGKILASASEDFTIRLWDPTTGQCLQKLGCHHFPEIIRFAENGSYLITTRGLLHLDSILPNDDNNDHGPSHNFYLADSWIMLQNVKHLWIPPEYRAYWCMDLQGNMIALGYPSGQIINLIF